ncbi:MAG TPA: hypothetical protein VJ914_11680 [Pseudonocardiaceae bacterium]|nr:hypothetical protein [Pseudonocardiaceae bacterium]
MTVAIPAVAEGASEAEASLAGQGAAGAAARKSIGVPKKTPSVPGAAPASRGKNGGKTPGANAPGQQNNAGTGSRGSRNGRSRSGFGSLRGFNTTAAAGKGSGAHRIVIAEFIACVVLIGASPLLTRQSTNGHLYVANDFLRMTGVCVLFFILALMSNSPQMSRFAAAFGGLVTLGALYNASAAITALAELFTRKAK